MTTVTIHAAKTQLSRLIEQVERGEEVAGREFLEPLPEEGLKLWAGS